MALQLVHIEDVDQNGNSLTCRVGDNVGLVLTLSLRITEGHFSKHENYEFDLAQHKEEVREFLLSSYRFLYTKHPVSFYLPYTEGTMLRFDVFPSGENNEDVQMLVMVNGHSCTLDFSVDIFGELVHKIDDYYRN